jgi:enolase-phosphatase E1
VTVRLAERGIRLVLLDIEGTTTPISFVHDVLFPYARAHLAVWCRDFGGSSEYLEIVRRLSAEHADDQRRAADVPPWRADTAETERQSVIAYARCLMDRTASRLV